MGDPPPTSGTAEKSPDRPWVLIPSTIVIVLLDWLYFAVLVPYVTIPNKPVFWSAIVAWALPPLLVVWRYRDAPELKIRNVTGNLLIGIGILGLIVSALWSRFEIMPPIGLAAMPAVLTGTMAGAIAGFVSNHHR